MLLVFFSFHYNCTNVFKNVFSYGNFGEKKKRVKSLIEMPNMLMYFWSMFISLCYSNLCKHIILITVFILLNPINKHKEIEHTL